MSADGFTFFAVQSTSSLTTMAATTAVDCNSTLNATADLCAVASPTPEVGSSSWVADVVAPLIAVLLSAVIIGTLLGNTCVILAVTVYDKMRTLSNVLIASLGSADLLVAIVVMPISLQVSNK